MILAGRLLRCGWPYFLYYFSWLNLDSSATLNEMAFYGQLETVFQERFFDDEKGIEKGIEKGRQEKMRKIAFKMLERQMKIEAIGDMTELPLEEVRKLARRMKKRA